MIHFNNVSKRYTNGHTALHDINFLMNKGEMAFLTGHSGAGKSTLLKLMNAIERNTMGQIIVNGKNLSRIAPHEIPYLRRQIGFVTQNPLLLVERNIFENVALPLVIAGMSAREMGRRTRAALDKVGLLDKEKFHPLELSAGEQQRVGIARAVVNRPLLLLADEPTGNLDHELSTEIMQLFAEFNRIGVTVLIASHDLSLVSSLSYRILVLRQGRLVGE